MDSIKYLRHAASVGGGNADNENYFCPVTIRKALEIAAEIERLRAEVEALRILADRVHMWSEFSDAELRLHAGEMTAPEIRSIRAVLGSISAYLPALRGEGEK